MGLTEIIVLAFLAMVFAPILGMAVEMVREWRKIHRRGDHA